jgi:hypothetical protein
LPTIPRALLLLLGLSSCASGGDTSDSYAGDDGGTTEASSQDGPEGDAPGDATRVDTGTGHDTGTVIADATADTASVEGGGGSDSSPPDTGAGDSSSTCAAHGFSGALVTFDLSSQTGSETSAAATSSATGVVGGALARASGLTPQSGAGSINSSGWPAASSADKSLYYTFTVTPEAGCTVSLTALALDVQASGTGPASVDVGTSVDGYVALSTAVAGTSSGSVPLSASAAAPVTIHVFGYGPSTGSGGTLRIQSTLKLSGTLN